MQTLFGIRHTLKKNTSHLKYFYRRDALSGIMIHFSMIGFVNNVERVCTVILSPMLAASFILFIYFSGLK